MRTAIIGGSGHYHYVLDGLARSSRHELCAVARGNAEEDMTALRARTENVPYYDDWREMLRTQRPEIVAVDPWYARSAEITTECLQAGLHVWSEKPMAVDTAALARLRAVWQKSGCALGCMLDGPHTSWLRTVKASIDAGDIGKIRLLHGQKSYRMGQRPGVYAKKSEYGGMLLWIASHPVSWFDYLLGTMPEDVTGSADAHENGGWGELESTGCMLLRYPDGILATINCDYYRPTGSLRHDDDRIRVTGTRGMLEVRDGEVWLENEQPRRSLALLEAENPFLAFADAIGTPKEKKLAEAALRVNEICLRAQPSPVPYY